MAKNGAHTRKAASPWNRPDVVSNHRARRRRQLAAKAVTVACVLAVLIPLGDMVYLFALRGLEVISFNTLFGTTASTSVGISNAIVGTFVIIGISSLIAIPLGLFGGIYMAEFARENRFTGGLRFAADVLAGVPSIVLGYVGFLVFVLYLGFGYSALAAGTTLAILMFPYIFRTTELAIRKVPRNLKEGAIALGSTKSTMINRLVLRFALPGILTGIILSVGIALSETAPLLYTASFSNYMPTAVTQQPIAYLTGLIFAFYQSPLAGYKDISFLSSFVLICIVLLLNVVARVGLRRFSKV